MPDKKTSWIYRVIRALVRFFSPRYRIEGAENLPGEPCVIVGNHSHMYGPIAGELFTPGRHYVWCAGEMMNRKEVHGYAFRDFWSGRPRALHWFYRLLSYLITPLALCVFNNAHTIAVYRDTRLISTYRESMEKLREGNHIVIFPECYDEYNNIVHDFHDKFVDLARFYYKKDGIELSFVPMYLAPALSRIVYGRPIRFNAGAPIAEERARICTALKEEITELALRLPPHTVVPYPNVTRRHYPKSQPLEVYKHEETGN